METSVRGVDQVRQPICRHLEFFLEANVEHGHEMAHAGGQRRTLSYYDGKHAAQFVIVTPGI